MIKEKLRGIAEDVKAGKHAPIVQFVKFGLVGVSNTLISYGVEMLCYYVFFKNVSWEENIRIAITSLLAFAVSVTNSYIWNDRFVFRQDRPKTFGMHVVAYLKTVACYGVTGLIIAPLLKMWIGSCGVPYWAGSLCSLIVTIPLNFVLNKFWAFRKKDGAGLPPDGDGKSVS